MSTSEFYLPSTGAIIPPSRDWYTHRQFLMIIIFILKGFNLPFQGDH